MVGHSEVCETGGQKDEWNIQMGEHVLKKAYVLFDRTEYIDADPGHVRTVYLYSVQMCMPGMGNSWQHVYFKVVP